MKRTLNVLLTLAIVASVVGFAYYVSEWLRDKALSDDSRRYPYDGGYLDSDAAGYIKFIVYWLTGFVGFYVCGRVVKTQSYMNNALLIAFGYLLVIGSHGGFDFSGANLLKILLSAANVGIFCFAYRQFQKIYYSPGT